MKRGAVILGGHIQALGLTRLLGEAGLSVVVIDYEIFNIARFSRYCTKFIHLNKKAYDNSKLFCYSLIKLCKKFNLRKWTIFPTNDELVKYISIKKKQLSKFYTVWNQNWETVNLCYDKRKTYDLADKCKIPYPKTFMVNNRKELEKIKDKISYPTILKPSSIYRFYEKFRKKVFVVNNSDKLINTYKMIKRDLPSVNMMIQEIIPGSAENLYSFAGFFCYDKPLGFVIGKRKRQIPMDFGKASTFVETDINNEITSQSIKILREINYFGLCEVEFKFDQRTNEYKLLEINPRSWKWHYIAKKENFPALLINYMKKNNEQRKITNENIAWIDLYTDLLIVFKEFINRKIDLRSYFGSLKKKKIFAVLDFKDIFPFIAETCFLPLLYLKRN